MDNIKKQTMSDNSLQRFLDEILKKNPNTLPNIPSDNTADLDLKRLMDPATVPVNDGEFKLAERSTPRAKLNLGDYDQTLDALPESKVDMIDPGYKAEAPLSKAKYLENLDEEAMLAKLKNVKGMGDKLESEALPALEKQFTRPMGALVDSAENKVTSSLKDKITQRLMKQAGLADIGALGLTAAAPAAMIGGEMLGSEDSGLGNDSNDFGDILGKAMESGTKLTPDQIKAMYSHYKGKK
jgi:hypothetical protein